MRKAVVLLGLAVSLTCVAAQDDAPWDCAECGKRVADKDTEQGGHDPCTYPHPAPCRYRVHKGCGGTVTVTVMHCSKCRKLLEEAEVEKSAAGRRLHKGCGAVVYVSQKHERPQEGRYDCLKCSACVGEDKTEEAGHEPGPHGHPGPCRYRIHKGCGGMVAERRDPKWKQLTPKRVVVRDDAWRKHDMIAFAGTSTDLPPRAEAHLEKDEKALKSLAALTPDHDVRFFLLWGWTRNGADPLNRTRVAASFNPEEKCVKVVVTSARVLDMGSGGGGAAMQYVGFDLPLGRLKPGTYTVKISEIVETFKTLGDTAPKRSKEKPKEEVTFTVGAQEDGDASSSVNDFAIDLYAKLREEEEGNVFFSPASISTALAMVYAGARGNTALEMRDVLHFDLPDKNLHPAMGKLAEALVAESKGSRVSIANALWPQKGYPFLEEYIALVRKCYGSELREVDYRSAVEEARQTINAWVEKKTNDKIKEL
ncbi:MAG: serpin family protein, partial [Planctomycetota bacterium]